MSTLAFAQFDGLDLTAPAPAPAPAKSDSKKKPEPKEKAASPSTMPGMELDLSTTANVGMVVLAPPTMKVTSGGGGFAGMESAKKVTEKFDPAAHRRLVSALEKLLEKKVISSEATLAAIAKEGISPTALRSAPGLRRLAKATNAATVVAFEVKNGSLVGTIYSAEGKAKGTPVTIANAQSISAKNADEIATQLNTQLVALSKIADQPAGKPETEVADTPDPGDVEAEAGLNTTVAAQADEPSFWQPDPTRPKGAVLFGPGAVFRRFSALGAPAADLAELRNNGVVGLGVYAQLNPLQFVPSLAGKRWSDLSIEAHFRRAIVHATATGTTAAAAQTCAMTDDDFQLRANYRYQIVDSTYSPLVGLGVGFSQERTIFACNLPVPSVSYRGLDLQLRIKQPLFRHILSLDLSGGPRFLLSDPTLTPGFSLAAEAWVEARPLAVVFIRGGGRLSRMQVVSNNGLGLVDLRMFFALEVGAFL